MEWVTDCGTNEDPVFHDIKFFSVHLVSHAVGFTLELQVWNKLEEMDL